MNIYKEMLFANRYKLLEKLGSGGYSEVWLAEDTDSNGIKVALKIYAPGSGLDSDGLKIFASEYSLVFNLNHPNLRKPMHYDKWEGMPYIIMQYLKNGNCLKLCGNMNENELALFMQQAASAVAYLHEQEPPIIHRDIKPDNFLIDDKGKYLLTDFGISSRIRRTLTKSMGDRSQSSGTTPYMAPENFSPKLDERAPTKANDIFSLGVTFFELLTTDFPYGNLGGMAAATGVECAGLPDGYSSGLRNIINACLNKNPALRPTAEQLYEAATAYLKTKQWPAITITAIKPEPAQPEAEKTKARKTAEIPVDKLPKPGNYKKDDSGGTIKPPFADSGIDNVPPAKHKRPWLLWLIILAVLAVLGIVIGIIVSNSGPSAEEIAAKEKLKADSIAAVAATVDSLKAVATADSIAAAINNTGKVGSETQTSTTTSGTGFTFDYPLVWVAGGTDTMGCTGEQGSDCYDDEKPSHSITVGSFNIGKYEVTQAQWKSVMGSNPSSFKGCDNCPVENVSWNDVQEFIKKLNSLTGKKYRLPKEAEWEFAARGGASTGSATANKYSGSDNVGSVAWYSDNSGSKTHPVGQKSPNELGIYDMSGNVWEWCSDWYKGYPGSSGVSDYTNSFRVLRGGGWYNSARYCRVSNRSYGSPVSRDYISNGFRLVLSP
ncbi:MAG TPA: SUMF1/EgtB/PvdO family nonheme iron enzyme [Bacteroidales bacterium]|nr:SUMF1/EgtB/PvdO family nonheme iron enzyme [Bacteroidales bacterium]